MIGQKLYFLISDLDTSERKYLFLRGKKTEDKRYKPFISLLGKKGNSTAEFQDALDKIKDVISPAKSNEKDKSDAIRRFIDFCIKEIENLKIEIYSKSNSKIRNYILAEIYDNSKTREVNEDYLEKLNKQTDKKDYWLKNYYLTKSASLKLRSQTTKDLDEWKRLIIEHKKLVQSHYQQEITHAYDRISASFLDDKRSIDLLEGEVKTEDDVLLQIVISNDTHVKASLYLTLARFFFRNEAKFKEYIDSAKELMKNYTDRESEILLRKIAFASFLHAFHFNHEYSKIKNLIETVIKINLKFDLEDHKSYFYLFLIQILQDDKKGDLNYFKSDIKKYFAIKTTDYLLEFLEAINFFKQKNYKSSKRILSNLSYTDNPYLASWARLLEIVINQKQGNSDFAETLLKSELKRMDQNKNRIFSINSNLKLMKELCNVLNIKIPATLKILNTEKTTLSSFHLLLSNELKNKS
jgi:hypothetical protein